MALDLNKIEQIEPKYIGVPAPYFDLSISSTGTLSMERPATQDTPKTTVTNGNGVNFGIGNRYQIYFPNSLPNARYGVQLTAVGNSSNNALIARITKQTTDSLEYVFMSGDDGGGVDDNIRTNHHVLITGDTIKVLQDLDITYSETP